MNIKCQVFTPTNYVEKLLDSVGYTENLSGKRILENSCGDGNILAEVVRRYILDCKRKCFAREEIERGLSKDIVGIEIDKNTHEKCIKRLDAILEEEGLSSIRWSIHNGDFLRTESLGEFDYIVGNPPYITYRELEQEERDYLRKSFKSCRKGKFDYCYAFIEKSISLLSQRGRMSYLVPSSIFKTVFGASLRQIMLPYVSEIRDYTQEKIFDTALVKSAIVVFVSGNTEKTISYKDSVDIKTSHICRTEFGSKWVFAEVNQTRATKRFGDLFKVSHSVATLLNEVYIFKDVKVNNHGNYMFGEHEIEKDLIRDAAAPKAFRTGRSEEKILFPYSYDSNHHLIRFSEDEFKKLYPKGYLYLLENKESLLKRDMEKNVLWFEYGRTQALRSLDREKCLISTIISPNKASVFFLSKESIPYAGMYVIPKKDSHEVSLKEGVEILQSDAFKRYAWDVGIHINGSSVRVTSKDIENYMF